LNDIYQLSLIFKEVNLKLNIFQINRVILEEKHETSLTNQIVLEQEQLSEINRNQIKQLEAEIELLTSENQTVISTNTQQSKDEAAQERATLGLRNN
jgi:rRNA-processing protein FCF1